MTADEASETFRCGPYACTMSGMDCAKRFATAAQTRNVRMGRCIGCPDGAQRASALGIGRPMCWAAPNGIVCGRVPEDGRRTCREHRSHEDVTTNAPQGRTERIVYDAAEPARTHRRPPDVEMVEMDCRQCRRRYMTSTRSPAEIREWCRRCRGSVRDKLRRAHRDDSPESVRRVLIAGFSEVERVRAASANDGQVECRECGAVGTRRLLDGDPLRPWCRRCRSGAAKALRVRGIEPQPEDVAGWLSTPKEQRARPAYYERHECPTCGQRVRKRRIKA